ncbi:hypothetical protein K438DRAFT_662594 [Mycena galopus ATCC 62051]|nr:hypothetical protein K438DRAFT_662594 [Mycena galopus ATCC 62051]
MSDDPKLPMPNLLDKAYLLDKFREGWLKRTPKHSPAPSPQPSRSTTPAPSNRHSAPAPGETAMNPYAMITVEIRPRKEVLQLRLISQILCSLCLVSHLEISNSYLLPYSECFATPVGPTYNVHVYGGTGGSGGQGGEHSGDGGTGEGPKLDIHDITVYVTCPDATKIQFIEKELTNHVTTQHKFTDQSKSLCAPGTRVEIQADILEWLSPQLGTN